MYVLLEYVEVLQWLRSQNITCPYWDECAYKGDVGIDDVNVLRPARSLDERECIYEMDNID